MPNISINIATRTTFIIRIQFISTDQTFHFELLFRWLLFIIIFLISYNHLVFYHTMNIFLKDPFAYTFLLHRIYSLGSTHLSSIKSCINSSTSSKHKELRVLRLLIPFSVLFKLIIFHPPNPKILQIQHKYLSTWSHVDYQIQYRNHLQQHLYIQKYEPWLLLFYWKKNQFLQRCLLV